MKQAGSVKNIGIIAKRDAPEAIEAVKEFLQCLKGRGLKLFIESELASALKVKGCPRQEIPLKADVIIVFGGDGTLLGVARLVGGRGVPVLGVNLGGLGFITEISKSEICRAIDKILSGRCRFEERIMLSADVYRQDKIKVQHTALNDVVINKSALARMIELEIHIEDQYVTTFKADGLIVSTPTGSTAHSLSAGGPIMFPTLESFVLTPICPHTLTSRPIVLPDSFVLDVRVKSGDDVYLTLDGQVGVPLKVDDRVRIRKAGYKIRFLLLQDRDYFRVLRTKLKWGER